MMRELIGQELGKYRLIRLLGQGGFAEVYLGQHIYLKSEAAIKILHTRMTKEQVLGFLQEAQVIARLIHPNIVRVLDFDVANNGVPFLVMDYCPHGTLRQRHAKAGPLPLETVLSYVEQVAPALHYAHENKLIHRDIKPENMLIGSQNQILLSDFGIASSAHSTSSMSAQIPIGTIYYMAPEQIQAQARPASDQYALGVTVYEWLCGERPFSGSYTEIFAKHLMTPPPSLRTKVPTLPPLVEEVVLKALAKDPHERFTTVQAFAMALRQAAQSSGVASIATNTVMPNATLPARPLSGEQPPTATMTPNVITPPANIGIPPTRLPVMGMARAGEAQTELPSLPAYPGQPFSPQRPPASQPVAPRRPRTPPDPLKQKRTRRAILFGLGAVTAVAGGTAILKHQELDDFFHSDSWGSAHVFSQSYGQEQSVLAIALSRDSQRIAISCASVAASDGINESSVTILAIDGSHVMSLDEGGNPGLSEDVNGIAWSPDGRSIATSSDDLHTLKIWDASKWYPTLGNTTPQNTYTFTKDLKNITWSPDGKYIAFSENLHGYAPGSAHVCDATTGYILTTYKGHTDLVVKLAWSPDSKRIASAGDKTVHVWDSLTGKTLFIYSQHAGKVNSVAWSADGKHIASCSDDKTVQVWNAATGSSILTYREHPSVVTDVSWSADGKRLVSCAEQDAVRVWNVNDGNTVFRYWKNVGGKMMVTWSPNGKYIAYASGDAASTVIVNNAPGS